MPRFSSKLSQCVRILRTALPLGLIGIGLCTQIALADTTVLRLTGKMTVSEPGGRTIRGEEKLAIADGSSIQTDADSKAVLRTERGIYVLGANSSLTVERPSFVKQFFGRIYYAIRKFSSRNREPLRVQTPTATMGVRGTEFLVSAEPELESVAMAEGEVSVDANEDGFNLYKASTVSDFEAYKQEIENGVQALRDEFEAYRQAEQREFVGFVKSLQLGEGESITIRGSSATTDEVSAAQEESMAELTRFAEDFLDEVRN